MKKLFIHIPKTAGNSIIKCLPVDRHGHKTPQEIIDYIGEEQFNAYDKFAIVRNPADRFLSAYSFLFQMKSSYLWWYYNKPDYDYVCSFKDFEHFCLCSEPLKMLHFRPQIQWLYRVEKVYHYETLQEDIFQDFGVVLPKENTSQHISWRDAFNVKMLNRLKRLYEDDYKLW